MHFGLGGAHAEQGRFEAAHDYFRQAQDRFDASGDPIGRARAHLGLAWMFDRQRRHRDALGHADSAPWNCSSNSAIATARPEL